MKTRNVAISEDAWLRVMTMAAKATVSAGHRVTMRKLVEAALALHLPAIVDGEEQAELPGLRADNRQQEFEFAQRDGAHVSATPGEAHRLNGRGGET